MTHVILGFALMVYLLIIAAQVITDLYRDIKSYCENLKKNTDDHVHDDDNSYREPHRW